MMRVAIDGAQSTGKTSLFKYLRGVCPRSLTFIPEASRIVAPRMGVHCPEDWRQLVKDEPRLLAFFKRLEQWQSLSEHAAEHFIVDSSFYLHHAYKRYFGVRDSGPPVARYDILLFCSTRDTPFVNDGFRFETGREEVEQLYLDVVRTVHKGELIELPAGNPRFSAAGAIILSELARR